MSKPTFDVLRDDNTVKASFPTLAKAKAYAKEEGAHKQCRAPRWIQTGYPTKGNIVEWWADTCDYHIRTIDGPHVNW